MEVSYTPQGLPKVSEEVISAIASRHLREQYAQDSYEEEANKLEAIILKENPLIVPFLKNMLTLRSEPRKDFNFIRLLFYSGYEALRLQATENSLKGTRQGHLLEYLRTSDDEAAKKFREHYEQTVLRK